MAIGAVAVGALAFGAMAIGRLSIRKARIRSLEVDDLTVRNLNIVDGARPGNESRAGTGARTTKRDTRRTAPGTE
ncbi:hypothetical protein [Allomesorhizobium alhagi]|jgi:hypothetical protein|uniref:Uncharacterized protein n=1 Tax=Mesorhizobium alhagi CCNWXJ12-2 TaxID=1107882 RepID=H0HUY0_9HYPH|nr:hypothetical protein [Mesorhizobium alhagi]EHK55459.1 hypothetical protein MAXJ12_19917 [Mesorhizobium alhagi CCNWXJ12-2]